VHFELYSRELIPFVSHTANNMFIKYVAKTTKGKSNPEQKPNCAMAHHFYNETYKLQITKLSHTEPRYQFKATISSSSESTVRSIVIFSPDFLFLLAFCSLWSSCRSRFMLTCAPLAFPYIVYRQRGLKLIST
jgi:hypothetical protein